MHLLFMDSRVPYLYILLVQWGSLVHSEHHVSTETLAIAGSTANVTCHFEPTNSNYKIAWVVNNGSALIYESMHPLEHDGDRRRPAADQSGSKVYLEISNVTFKDAGSYKCQRYVIGVLGGTAETRVNTLHVQGDMQVEVDINVTLNDPITAECCVRSTKSARNVPFVWFIGSVWSVNDKFGETVPTDPNITYCRHISINSELRFHDKFFGCSISSELNVTSTKPLHIFSKAIVILITRRDTNRKAAKDSAIRCLANGIPPPDVQLQRLSNETEWRNHYVEEQQIEKTEDGGNVLWNFHIIDKQYRDDVTYRCIANNTNDEFAHSSSTTLTVTQCEKTCDSENQRMHIVIIVLKLQLCSD
ncbi:hypothetical protein BSL78_01978 [Apostichopus japonicus]|uniref:Ig-like domain-containing protein n=1 Tax=Stichopus japonicus TaxID=307972 RepID=A0A2G8LLD2_STIJA|nr:hypothetical protein BSL78_01978 [Apostichopus japonicus]